MNSHGTIPKPPAPARHTSTGGPVGAGPWHGHAAQAPRSILATAFAHVRFAGRVSRSQLARDLGVSPASVTVAVEELLDRGLLAEDNPHHSPGRGRPSVDLHLRRDAFRLAGLSVSPQAITLSIANLAGEVLTSRARPLAAPFASASDLLDSLHALVQRETQRPGLAPDGLASLAIGITGTVDAASGSVLESPLFPDRNLPLARLATQRFGLPVQVDSDSAMITHAERWFGLGHHPGNFAVVTLSPDLTLGLVQEGFPCLRSGIDLAHLKLELNGDLCTCGQTGCAAAYLTDAALAARAAAILPPGQNNLAHLYLAAEAGLPQARQILYRADRYLATALGHLVNLFSLDTILLTGPAQRLSLIDLPSLHRGLATLTHNPCPVLRLRDASPSHVAQGAIALTLDHATELLLTKRP